MKYCILCGGYYEQFETPKHLLKINGERIAERTIRLLKENGVTDIVITATDKRFDGLGVPRIEHKNTYRQENGTQYGYWLDAFYPFKEPTTYIFGDVYFSDDAIKTIVSYDGGGNVLFGSALATNKLHMNWGEPFAYVVNDTLSFFAGIKAVKRLQDEGKTDRMPVVWELYRYLNGLDVNIHEVKPDTFKVIDDITIDVDSPEAYDELKGKVEQ